MAVFEDRAGLAVGNPADLLSPGAFVATGLVISFLNDRLHAAQAALRATADLATSCAERLDAIPPAGETTFVIRLPMSSGAAILPR